MKWNDGKERKKFEKEQERLRKEYEAAGMTEEQIKNMYDFDLSLYKKRRINAIHTQPLDLEAFDDDESDEGQNPLFEKFAEFLSVTPSYTPDTRFGWIEELENERLVKAIKSMPDEYKEILTCIVVDEMSQEEISVQFGVSQPAISKKIKKISTFFEKWL